MIGFNLRFPKDKPKYPFPFHTHSCWTNRYLEILCQFAWRKYANGQAVLVQHNNPLSKLLFLPRRIAAYQQ